MNSQLFNPMDILPAKEAIDQAIAAGEAAAARALLQSLWNSQPTSAIAPFIVARFERLRGNRQMALVPCKLALLRSFTVEPLVPLVRAVAFIGGIDLDVRVGDFNAFAQEIIDPNSWVGSFGPDAAILAVQTRDVAPVLWSGFADCSAQQVEFHVDQVVGQFRQLITSFRSRSSAHLIVHNLQTPPNSSQGILDAQSAMSQSMAIAQINAQLIGIAARSKNVYLLDYDRLIARRGADHFEDLRKWLMARLPVAAGELLSVVKEWVRFLHPITGRVCKCLVVDLDNTLWGGVIGEDGIDGIRLDAGQSGFAYQSLQRAMLDLHRRGIILAIASKNNPAEAREAIEKHPGMILRPEHFAAMRINWNDKAASLREIAAELNIGIDSLAFLDDNAVEREWVQNQLPEVTVIDLADDPLGYAAALRDSPVFERLSLTDEDRQRGQMYAQERMREEMQSSAASLEEFYRSLGMTVEIAPVTPATLARAAQLTQKTNQFNLTTRRYTEQQIQDFISDPDHRVCTIKVKDRLGDSGLVGVAITHDRSGVTEIDTLLLSCRVIGRTIETSLLAHLAHEARNRGSRILTGWYLPTKKNLPCRDFYQSQGFRAAEQSSEGTRWELDLSDLRLSSPPWINLKITT